MRVPEFARELNTTPLIRRQERPLTPTHDACIRQLVPLEPEL